MPKKLGLNSKAVEARARKDEKKRADNERVEKEKEDALWQDDDKHIARKMNRKEDKEKKKSEVAERKAANREAYESEMGPIEKGDQESSERKITRAQISTTLERQQQLVEKQRALEKAPTVVDEVPLEENINRLQIDGEARNVDDAIAVLSGKTDEIDRHPERRLKAAYAAFEDIHLPRLKLENPNLRLSQLKQMLKKDWMKSPDNPMNKAFAVLSK